MFANQNHQIRVHFAHLGHPLIGDEFYKANGQFHPLRPKATASSAKANQKRISESESIDPDVTPFESDEDELDIDPIETGFPIRRHALHACRLAFAHPISGLWMEFHSQLPEDFRQTIEILRQPDAAISAG